jgi:hypothetical protein
MAIMGVMRLANQKGFSREEEPDEVRERWANLAMPIQRFISECLKYEPDFKISKAEVRKAYEDFIRSHNWPMQPWNLVAGEIVRLFGGPAIIKKGKGGLKGEQYPIFIGLRITTKEERDEDAPEDPSGRYPGEGVKFSSPKIEEVGEQ